MNKHDILVTSLAMNFICTLALTEWNPVRTKLWDELLSEIEDRELQLKVNYVLQKPYYADEALLNQLYNELLSVIDEAGADRMAVNDETATDDEVQLAMLEFNEEFKLEREDLINRVMNEVANMTENEIL